MVIFFYSGINRNAMQILQISKKVKSAKKRYAEAIDEEEASIIKRNAGRSSLSSRHQNSEG